MLYKAKFGDHPLVRKNNFLCVHLSHIYFVKKNISGFPWEIFREGWGDLSRKSVKTAWKQKNFHFFQKASANKIIWGGDLCPEVGWGNFQKSSRRGAPPSREKPACEVTSVTVRGRNKGRSQVITGHFLVLTGQKIVKFSFVWSFSTKK